MNWIDITLIVVWLVFIAVGARLGSLWSGSCVISGFVGAFLADYYAPSLSGLMGNFSGSLFLSGVLLFLFGLGLILSVGWVFSRISSAMFLGIVDSAFGFLTGALTGLVAISLVLILLVPMAPSIEKSKSWKTSGVAKPLHGFLETLFSGPRFRPASFRKRMEKSAKKQLKPAREALEKIKDAADDLVDDIKN